MLFALPVLLFFSVPAAVLWLGGEWMGAEEVAACQNADPKREVLHGPAFSNHTIHLKLRLIQQRRPAVLALGTSRVLQFRAGFFLPNATFYNGGSCIQRVTHFRQLLDRLPIEGQPEVLLLGLDQYWFNPNSGYSQTAERGAAWFTEQCALEPAPLEILRQHWWQVDQDLCRGVLDARQLLSLRGHRQRIGFTAFVWNQGTRQDGSYQYRTAYQSVENPQHYDYRFAESFRKIERGLLPFEYGRQLHPPALQEIDRLLAECQRRGIMVVGFLPPFPHAIIAKMESMGDRYDYLQQLEPALRPLFARHGAELYNFTDAGELNAPDRESLDGFHAAERTYLRAMIAMLQQGSRLNNYAALPELDEILETTTENSDLVATRH